MDRDAIGATPFIAFKAGTEADNGCEVWRKMFHYFQFKPADFLARYHKRSNVETTFSMLKRRFDAPVRS
jgi:transposase